MKVTIDTKEDSYEDIHKILQILTHILQQRGAEIKSTEPADTTNLMSMFDSTGSASDKNIPEKAPDFSSFLNLTKETTPKKEERAEIEYY